MTPLRSKFTAACLAVMLLSAFLLTACQMGLHAEKHTGPFTVMGHSSHGNGTGDNWQFKRPNGEIFVMIFDYHEAPTLTVGQEYSDLTYTDKDQHERFFIKATLAKDATALALPIGTFESYSWNVPATTATTVSDDQIPYETCIAYVNGHVRPNWESGECDPHGSLAQKILRLEKQRAAGRGSIFANNITGGN